MKTIVMILIILCLVITPLLVQSTPAFATVKVEIRRYDPTIIVDPWWLFEPFIVVDGKFVRP
jgi:hypothetical protein